MSAFVKECWRLAGTEVLEPQKLDQLFKELERRREESKIDEAQIKRQAAELDQEILKTSALRKELERAQAEIKLNAHTVEEVKTLRLELARYQEREGVHLRPLFSAIAGHLMFPDAPENESVASLRQRVDRARSYKVLWNSDSNQAAETVAEIERLRIENNGLRQAMLDADARDRDAERSRVRRDYAVSELNDAIAELGRARVANAQLERTIDSLNEGLRACEAERVQLKRLVVANRELDTAINLWAAINKEVGV